jgi:hypothetical protein
MRQNVFTQVDAVPLLARGRDSAAARPAACDIQGGAVPHCQERACMCPLFVMLPYPWPCCGTNLFGSVVCFGVQVVCQPCQCTLWAILSRVVVQCSKPGQPAQSVFLLFLPGYAQKKSCPLGDACSYAHNVFEHWLHPSRFVVCSALRFLRAQSVDCAPACLVAVMLMLCTSLWSERWGHSMVERDRYKTRLCSFGRNCNRPICFFAHSADELRCVPNADDGVFSCPPPKCCSCDTTYTFDAVLQLLAAFWVGDS